MLSKKVEDNYRQETGVNNLLKYKIDMVWRNVISIIILHALALYGFYLGMSGHGKWQTLLYHWFIGLLASIGIQAGAHRLWSHRSYKATLPLRILLAIMQTIALQNDIYEWCRDHRVHHRYSETDADPHNSKRGFFFSHMGWLLCRKHPHVRERGKLVDMSDLWADPVVRFQRRFYVLLVIIFWAIIPMAVPIYVYGETVFGTICGNSFRYVYSLHVTWTVNSVAHLYGQKPYDRSVNARESAPVVYLAMGEGYHNYHHVFPHDYSASEFGWRDNWNPATAFIDLCATVGWAYDRKVANSETIRLRSKRCGERIGRYRKFSFWVDFAVGLVSSFYLFGVILLLRILFS